LGLGVFIEEPRHSTAGAGQGTPGQGSPT